MEEPEIILWLASFYSKSNLTKVLFEELLTFISVLTENKVVNGPLSSMHLFKKYLAEIAPMEEMSIYLFCENCKAPILKDSCGNRCRECQNELNAASLMKRGLYFVYGSIETSLRNTLEVASNEKSILLYKEKMQEDSTSIRDVMDSNGYRDITSRCDSAKFQGSDINIIIND